MLERIICIDRAEWLAARNSQGIGGSEAAAAVGMSPWMTPLELWKLKIGMEEPKDLSDNAAVQQGVRMEPALRDFFAAMHPELKVDYHQFDLLYQTERPWLFATLDGELHDAESGRDGILEIKTSTPSGKAGWEAWANGNMPSNYYCQVLHQMLATGFDFVYLFAALYSLNGDIVLREYSIDRKDVEEDLKWLLSQETNFYKKNIIGGVMPSMPLML